jgi:hypothetical protein
MSSVYKSAYTDLNGTVSFGGGGGGGGGSSSRGSRGRRERRATSGERGSRTQDAINNALNPVVTLIGDATIGETGDNPDMGAMSDARRGSNSGSIQNGGFRGSFGRVGGGR